LNFLAHLLLADDSDASRIGNLLGDFTRGPIAELAKIYPPEIVRGIFMHRAVDRYTDSHSAFKRSRTLLHPERRRFAGIIVDLIYDHFLSMHWGEFSNVHIDNFCQQVYRELEAHPEWHAGRLAEIVPVMKRENWLMRYHSIDGMRLTMSEVSQRSPRISKMAQGIDDLLENYDALEEHFMDFMPDLVSFVASWKEQH
jgi:acyl carrier protein phosphodiesterase